MAFWKDLGKKRELKQQLSQQDPETQVIAARDLAQLGDDSGLQVLEKYLYDRELTADCLMGLLLLVKERSSERAFALIQQAAASNNARAHEIAVTYLVESLGLSPQALLQISPENYVKYLIEFHGYDIATSRRKEDTLRSMPDEFLPILQRVYAQYPLDEPEWVEDGRGGRTSKCGWRQRYINETSVSGLIRELEQLSSPRLTTTSQSGKLPGNAQRCPNCRAIFPAGDRTCPSCGSGGDCDLVQPLESPFEVDGLGTPSDLPKEAWAPGKGSLPAGLQVGRNDPCPCGSGRRYKKCHGSYHVQ
jgi:hypothetical protein